MLEYLSFLFSEHGGSRAPFPCTWPAHLDWTVSKISSEAGCVSLGQSPWLRQLCVTTVTLQEMSCQNARLLPWPLWLTSPCLLQTSSLPVLGTALSSSLPFFLPVLLWYLFSLVSRCMAFCFVSEQKSSLCCHSHLLNCLAFPVSKFDSLPFNANQLCSNCMLIGMLLNDEPVPLVHTHKGSFSKSKP